jgi:C4-dicarboxylate-specific signal transduction histidine kinase
MIRLRHADQEFFGRVTAGQSHEIVNVLNIINEYAGLLRDLTQAAERGQPADPARFYQLVEKIKVQVARGESLCRDLNRFAHSVDVRVASIDLRELVERVLVIAKRRARLCRTSLEAELPQRSITMDVDPFDLQHLLYSCLEIALDASTEIRRVTVCCSATESAAEICVISGDPVPEVETLHQRLALLELLLDELGGHLVTVPDGGDERRLVFALPMRSPSHEVGPG